MLSCCYSRLGRTTMLWVLCILQLMFYDKASGCVSEERIALMRIRSSLEDANSQVPASWRRSGYDDCCSWERVTCNGNNTRVSDLDLSHIYVESHGNGASVSSATKDGCSWNLNLELFSSFRELQLLDLSSTYACLHNFSGLQGLTKLRYLNLSDNSLIGSNILRSLGKLSSLEVIKLVRNDINDTLQNTAFRNLTKLREVHLGSNQLRGRIPSSLFELPHLEHLDLSGNLLHGPIPTSSSSLMMSLQTLKLSANNLNGVFDFFWLRNCTMLKMIDLSGNTDLAVDVKFRGRLPSFQLKALMLSGCKLDRTIIAGPNFLGTQRHLQALELSNNNLSGRLPDWIFENVESLVYLDLSNNLLVGSIDSMWRHHYYNLKMINISANHFVGQLPTNISLVFPNLVVLDVSRNIISGDLPPSLCNISMMEFMDLSNNKFTGEVPACLFTDLPLLVLKLSNNNLGGSVFGGASNLSVAEIYLDNNNFEGTLPNNLSGISSVMDLHDNRLSGKLNSSFWNLSSLHVLSVVGNNLTGEIHPMICKLNGLRFLDLSNNNFDGSIPKCTRELTLSYLNMSSNSFSGVPSGFFNSSYITILDLRYNQFSGTLDWIQFISQIKLLFLGWNKFEGQIPPSICDLQQLDILDISHNRLSGSLASCIGGISFGRYQDSGFWSMMYASSFAVEVPSHDSDVDPDSPYLSYGITYDLQGFTFSTKGSTYTYSRNFCGLMFGIDLSANMLSGEIPWEIGNLSHIKSLDLSHNFFTGQIPDNFGNMSAIESLDLSHNDLSGPIPWDLTRLSSLAVFSVAYNNLSGCIPDSTQFETFNMDSYQGNKNLQNILSRSNGCPAGLSPIAPTQEDDVGDEMSDDPILYVVSAASFVMAFWATVAFSFCHPYGRSRILNM